MMAKYKAALDLLKGYRYLGEKQLEDGTQLIAKALHIAPLAWLHSIYPPLLDSEIDRLEQKIGIEIPQEYRAFLKVSNGLKVFNTTFCLDGLRRNYKRTVEEARQPFDICTPNIAERPINAEPGFFFIGGYDWDGSLLFMDKGRVFLCDREDATPKYEWASFDEMLLSEIKRLSTLFDKDGKEINHNDSTLPTDY